MRRRRASVLAGRQGPGRAGRARRARRRPMISSASKRAVAAAPRHGSRQGWGKGSRKREPEPAAHSCHRVKFSGSPRRGELGKGSRRHQSGRCVTSPSPGRPDWRADPDGHPKSCVRFQRTHLRASHDSLPSSSDETVLGRPRSGITGHIFHFVSTNHDG